MKTCSFPRKMYSIKYWKWVKWDRMSWGMLRTLSWPWRHEGEKEVTHWYKMFWRVYLTSHKNNHLHDLVIQISNPKTKQQGQIIIKECYAQHSLVAHWDHGYLAINHLYQANAEMQVFTRVRWATMSKDKQHMWVLVNEKNFRTHERR